MDTTEFVAAHLGRKCKLHLSSGIYNDFVIVGQYANNVVVWGLERKRWVPFPRWRDYAKIQPPEGGMGYTCGVSHIIIEGRDGYADWYLQPASPTKTKSGKKEIPPFPHKCRCGAPALVLGTSIDCSSSTCPQGFYKRGFPDQTNMGTGLDLMGFPPALLGLDKKSAPIVDLNDPKTKPLFIDVWRKGGCAWCGSSSRYGRAWSCDACFLEAMGVGREEEMMRACQNAQNP